MLDPLESFVIFPVHLNSSKSNNQGRRYSKAMSIADPTYKEIKQALDSLNVKYSDDQNKRHPKDFEQYGLFRVDKTANRKEIIQNIVKFISGSREKKTSNNISNNPLNLMPKKKQKKGKK